MSVKLMRLSDLKPSKYNPRVKLKPTSDEYKDIRRSLLEYGLVEPLVVNEANGCIVGGHQRWQVMLDMGWEEAECEIVYITDPLEEKSLCIALNKISGDWEEDKLNELLDDPAVSRYFTGFSDEEVNIDDMLDEEEPEPEQQDTVDVIIKIGKFQFTVRPERYEQLIDGIKQMGYHDEEEISAVMRRKILFGDG